MRRLTPGERLAVVTIVLTTAITVLGITHGISRHYQLLRENQGVCFENLSRIDGAKQQWGIGHAVQQAAVPSWDDLIEDDTYIKKTPVCPAGGHYMINNMVTVPTCSLGSIEGPYSHSTEMWIHPDSADNSHENSAEN